MVENPSEAVVGLQRLKDLEIAGLSPTVLNVLVRCVNDNCWGLVAC